MLTVEMAQTDPRIYFAAERTLMAWIRTAVALIGLGFMVSRFGTFLRIVAGQSGDDSLWLSLFIGVGLILMGTLVIALAAVQHKRFVSGLQAADLPRGYSTLISGWIAFGLTLIGFVLAAYLVFSTL